MYGTIPMKDQNRASSESTLTIPPADCDILEHIVHCNSTERAQSVWTNRAQGTDGTTS